jgi:hypothetical protein
MNKRTVASLAALIVTLAACGGGLTQADVDAAVEAALASTSTTEAQATEATPTTTRPPTTTTRPPTTTTTQPSLEASDFFAEIDVLESSCFGSAGANVEFEVRWGWPGEAYGTLTYEIRGLDDGAVNIDTTEIVGTEFQVNSHFVGIPSCDPDSIIVVPTRFRSDD